ncbi:MAG TPA: virulence factor TspB C-terminal domain-related protein [Burkholderiaceae bacterium]|nr:virulence factor TspB C-terminal domain-related protein [Burkholderiaceae bacterium]
MSGDCENTACEGDAITCAILRQQRKEYCENQKESDISNLGKSIMAGSDPKSLPSVANASSVDLSSTLDSSGFLGGGSCFSDRSFSYGGMSLTIPFSRVCEYLLPLRVAIMLMALLASFRLLSQSILRE